MYINCESIPRSRCSCNITHEQSIVNHGNQTYIASTAIDNYSYAEDEEIELTSTFVREQTRKPVREPPIGASTTFKITETGADNVSASIRVTATPVSPKRNPPNGTKIASPRSGHQIETKMTPPHTPKKDASVIVTSNPRKSRASESPRQAVTVSPRRQQMYVQDTATVPPRKAMLPASAARPSVRAVKYVLTSRASTLPHHNTAVISPMYTSATSARISGPQKQEPFLATGLVCRKSPTGVDTSPGLKASWIHMPTPYQTPPTGTIVTAGATLLLCGAITIVLSLYMMSKAGRRYYLDFGVLSGFGSVLLGCLGFRSRRWLWLPNRNYVSGYIILSMFSLLTCAGLISILTLQPKPGEPLADLAGGAVCGIAVLSLILAAFGVLSSRCCKYPPPDNRVEHCAEGFTL
ncbi:early nodulin-like protein 2 isoform X2 [Cryptotermes secundus]|uniref:early nodulin-like protein 2 isoform X2 n=1 Tax=Cryptotermes secundus TaxID=105785 RepID=UPI001454E203|nr:early nodulin-like protein 2 isoform X2 [Cryptotermes secundus]